MVSNGCRLRREQRMRSLDEDCGRVTYQRLDTVITYEMWVSGME